MQSEKKERTAYLDLARILAAFAVIVLHVSGQNFAVAGVDGSAFTAMIFYDSAVRCAVPLFVMISGALLLARDLTFADLFNRVGRLALHYGVWSLLYAVAAAVPFASPFGWKSFVLSVIGGHYHLWYLPMLAGLYLCQPLLRRIVTDGALLRWFLSLSFLFGIALPSLGTLSGLLIGGDAGEVIGALCALLRGTGAETVLGYSFYFVAGYALSRAVPTRRSVLSGGAMLIGGVLLTFALTALASQRTGAPQDGFFSYFSFGVASASLGAFTLLHGMGEERRSPRIIASLSGCCLGVYLIHPFFLELLQHFGIHTMTLHPLLSIPLLSLGIGVLSFALSFVLSRIPVLRRLV